MKKIVICFCSLVLCGTASAQDYKTCMQFCYKEKKDFDECHDFCVEETFKGSDKVQACKGAIQRSKKQSDALRSCKDELEAAGLDKPIRDAITSMIEEIMDTPDAKTNTAEYHELFGTVVDVLKSFSDTGRVTNPDWDEDFLHRQSR